MTELKLQTLLNTKMRIKPRFKLRLYAEQINSEIFHNKLDISKVHFELKHKEHKGARAWYWRTNEIPIIQIIKTEHDNEFGIFHSIAHELIHYYQDNLAIPINHGGKFFRYYKRKICDFYNIDFNKDF
jgi:hypothetical protein